MALEAVHGLAAKKNYVVKSGTAPQNNPAAGCSFMLAPKLEGHLGGIH